MQNFVTGVTKFCRRRQTRCVALFAQMASPEIDLLARPLSVARSVRPQPRRVNPRLAQGVIENHQAVVKPGMAVRQFKVVDGSPRLARFDKILQVIAPITRASPERKWPVDFIRQLEARHQVVQRAPWIAE